MSSALGIYEDDVFKMACEQFRVIADYLEIPESHRERLMMPKRAIAVTLPVHMDDGSTKTFQGYRVQHHLTLGPTKGGTRFAPDLSMARRKSAATFERRNPQMARGWRHPFDYWLVSGRRLPDRLR